MKRKMERQRKVRKKEKTQVTSTHFHPHIFTINGLVPFHFSNYLTGKSLMAQKNGTTSNPLCYLWLNWFSAAPKTQRKAQI